MSDSPEPGWLTRRGALSAAAGTGAALLGGSPAELATALGWRPPVFDRWVGSVTGQSAAIRAPTRFALVGIEWADPADARIELRTRGRSGAWTRWASASTLGHDPDSAAGRRTTLFGEPVWSGPAEFVQLRSSRRLRGVRVHFVSPPLGAPVDAGAAAAQPLAGPTLPAGPGQPPIISRSVWAGSQASPAVAPSYGTVRLAFVHHTENLNGYLVGDVPAMLLAIFQYHRFVRGWDDIGYNFVIDAFGRIWEARKGGIDAPVVGAQAGGYNQVSTGVAVLGSFVAAAPPPAAITALERLLAWKLALHGLPALGRVTVRVNRADAFYTPFAPGEIVSLPRIAGHRDGDSTDCPGDAFYARLPAVRARVAQLEGSPAALSLNAPAATVLAGSPTELSGRLKLPNLAATAGAQIEIQTLVGGDGGPLAITAAAADGSWAVAIKPSHSGLIRALHRAPPATVSDLAPLEVSPRIMLTVDSLSPLRVSGTVSPSKRRVTVELYKLSGGHRQLVARTAVALANGRFRTSLPTRGRGAYEVRARTSADARNAAGLSAPAQFRV